MRVSNYRFIIIAKSENKYLKTHLAEVENKADNLGPFDAAQRVNTSPADLPSLDLTQLDIIRKQFEEEKKQITEQRAKAEERCVTVSLLSVNFIVKTGKF